MNNADFQKKQLKPRRVKLGERSNKEKSTKEIALEAVEQEFKRKQRSSRQSSDGHSKKHRRQHYYSSSEDENTNSKSSLVNGRNRNSKNYDNEDGDMSEHDDSTDNNKNNKNDTNKQSSNIHASSSSRTSKVVYRDRALERRMGVTIDDDYDASILTVENADSSGGIQSQQQIPQNGSGHVDNNIHKSAEDESQLFDKLVDAVESGNSSKFQKILRQQQHHQQLQNSKSENTTLKLPPTSTTDFISQNSFISDPVKSNSKSLKKDSNDRITKDNEEQATRPAENSKKNVEKLSHAAQNESENVNISNNDRHDDDDDDDIFPDAGHYDSSTAIVLALKSQHDHHRTSDPNREDGEVDDDDIGYHEDIKTTTTNNSQNTKYKEKIVLFQNDFSTTGRTTTPSIGLTNMLNKNHPSSNTNIQTIRNGEISNENDDVDDKYLLAMSRQRYKKIDNDYNDNNDDNYDDTMIILDGQYDSDDNDSKEEDDNHNNDKTKNNRSNQNPKNKSKKRRKQYRSKGHT